MQVSQFLLIKIFGPRYKKQDQDSYKGLQKLWVKILGLSYKRQHLNTACCSGAVNQDIGDTSTSLDRLGNCQWNLNQRFTSTSYHTQDKLAPRLPPFFVFRLVFSIIHGSGRMAKTGKAWSHSQREWTQDGCRGEGRIFKYVTNKLEKCVYYRWRRVVSTTLKS